MALPVGMSSCAMCVEIMTGTTWVVVTDNMNVVEPPESSRMQGEGYVFGEDIALLTSGKLEPIEIPVHGIWAQGTADPFYTAYLAHTTPCGALLALRWSPAGCATSSDAFSTSTTNSKIANLVYVGGDATDANPLMFSFVVRTPSITRAAWA